MRTLSMSWPKPEWWLLILGLITLSVPTLYRLATDFWSQGVYDHGMFVLAAAAWVFVREWHAIQATYRAAAPWWALGLLFAALALYVIGRSQDVIFFEVSGVFIAIMACLLLYGGYRALHASIFPLALLLVFLPYPSFLVDILTSHLKEYVSAIAEMVLYALGYPIGRDGVMITIGPYQLFVADACAGLHSIFSLTAIGLLYLYITGHASRWRNGLIILLLVPLAVAANVVRVLVLILLTYHFGNDVGQGYAHSFAHILLFVSAVFLLVGFDWVLGKIGFAGTVNR